MCGIGDLNGGTVDSVTPLMFWLFAYRGLDSQILYWHVRSNDKTGETFRRQRKGLRCSRQEGSVLVLGIPFTPRLLW
jgi:hypothetical protein